MSPAWRNRCHSLRTDHPKSTVTVIGRNGSRRHSTVSIHALAKARSDMAGSTEPIGFVHLHTHSSYSPMWGIPTVETLCEAARAQGQDIVALTDTNGLYGAIHFLDVAKQAGLKPILGAQLVHQDHRAVLLAKTPDGYSNLCRVLSARHEEADFDFTKAVARYRAGLVILSDDFSALAAWCHDAASDLYVELSPGSDTQEAITFSRRMGVPPIATSSAALLHPRDFGGHRLLRAIADNTTLSRLKAHRCCAASHWLMPPAVLTRYFPHVPEALTNSRRIAEQCHTAWDFSRTVFPSFRQMAREESFETLRTKTYDGALCATGPSPRPFGSGLKRN